MSTSDKTRQKLMESMRRTKAGTKKKPARTQSAGAKSPRKVTKKAPPKARKKPLKTTGTKKDPYQSGQRVWPD